MDTKDQILERLEGGEPEATTDTPGQRGSTASHPASPVTVAALVDVGRFATTREFDALLRAAANIPVENSAVRPNWWGALDEIRFAARWGHGVDELWHWFERVTVSDDGGRPTTRARSRAA